MAHSHRIALTLIMLATTAGASPAACAAASSVMPPETAFAI